jgi:rhodanese-related sulfurtransferase
MKKTGFEALYIIVFSFLLTIIATFVYPPTGSLFGEENFGGEDNVIDLATAKKIFISGKALWIDARPENNYNEGHISGSINIPLPGPVNYRRQLFEKWEKDRLIVNYCSSFSCPIAQHLAAEMKFMGFSNVLVYTGGYADWIENGMPVEKTEEAVK